MQMGRTPLSLPEPLLSLIYKSYFLSRRKHSFPFDLDYLKHPFAVDTTRARTVLGFTPKVM